MTEPIRKSILPTTPPPEWEFSSVLGAPHGCALLPGDTGPVVVRRRVSYGDWEPVRPDRWADEPAARQATPVGPCGCGAPATPNVIHRQGAPCYMDQDGGLQTVELPTATARQTTGQDDTKPAPCHDCEHPKKLHDQRGCNGHWGPEEGCTCPYTNTGHTACKGATVCGDNDELCKQHEREQLYVELETARYEVELRQHRETRHRARIERAEAAIARVRAECDRIEAAVNDNPTSPDLAGGYLACLRHIRAALDGTA